VIYQKKRRNKFNAQRTEFGGVKYDSKKEAAYAAELEYRRKAGEITAIIPHYKIALRVNGKLIANYYVDFRVVNNSGGVEFHEVKSAATMTALWRMKWRILEATLEEVEPGAELIVVK